MLRTFTLLTPVGPAGAVLCPLTRTLVVSGDVSHQGYWPSLRVLRAFGGPFYPFNSLLGNGSRSCTFGLQTLLWSVITSSLSTCNLILVCLACSRRSGRSFRGTKLLPHHVMLPITAMMNKPFDRSP